MTEAALTVGAELQRAREARGLALSEVAQQLKFAPRQLEALEQDRFDLLPGGTFARGMVRNYARLLRVDAEPLVRRLADRYEPPDAGTLAARYSQPVPFSDSARRSTFVYLGLSLGVLALGGGVAWQWYHERHRSPALVRTHPPKTLAQAPRPKAEPPRAARTEPAHPAKTEPARPAKSESARVAKAAEKRLDGEAANAVPAKPAPVASTRPDEPAPDKAASEKAASEKSWPVAKVAPGLHRLVIRCEEQAWLEVRDEDGTALISSLNPAGSERALRARGPLTVVIGNAQHVRLLHNDQPIDLSPYTKVETARFTLP